VCEKCQEPILNEIDGVIIRGNIYIANPRARSGIISNNFPVKDKTTHISESIIVDNKILKKPIFKFSEDEIQEVAYHTDCLIKILKNIK
jgi:hypothetical protein